MPKPIDFGSQPAIAEKSRSPAPIVFGPSPITKPSSVPAPKPAAASPKPIEFGNAPPVQYRTAKVIDPTTFATRDVRVPVAAAPSTAFGFKESPACAEIIARMKATVPQIFATYQQKMEQQCRNLIPFTVEGALNWGQKHLEKVRDLSTDAANLVRQFTLNNGNDLCERARQSMQPKSGFFARKSDPRSFMPSLAVQQTNLQSWAPQCASLLAEAAELHTKLTIRLTVFSVAMDVVGTPPDNELDRVLNNRRMILQQSAMQAELTLKSLEQFRQQIVDQRMQIDQLVNVTIPAYLAAQSR